VRAFMLIAILMVLISFGYSVKVIAQLPVLKHRNQRTAVSLVIPALLTFVGGKSTILDIFTLTTIFICYSHRCIGRRGWWGL